MLVTDIRETAEAFRTLIETDFGVQLRYDHDSIEWIDSFIELTRPWLTEAVLDDLTVAIGAVLGETIIANYGGQWERERDEWHIRFEDSSSVYPFSKTRRQLTNGGEDSILSFFKAIPIIRKNFDLN